MGLPRRPAAPLLAAALAALAVACGGGDEGAADGPGVGALAGKNLLLVTIDTLRADHLGSYGDDRATTPNLDALAAGGTRFEHAYTAVPLTLPSHSVMFTGRRPFTTGVRVNGIHYLDEAERTLAERFRDAGYDTGATVSAYVMVSKFGLAQGFDVYEDSLTMDDVYRFYAEIPADEAVRRFQRWLDRRSSKRPFFAWLHLFDPHQPYAPPAPWNERFADDPYRGEIAFTDSQLGVLLADLEARGLTADTAVVVTSDHGEAFGEHGEEGHGLLAYEETLRVPLLFHAPEVVAAGRVVGERVSLYDLTPTLVELFGLDAGTLLPGRSLVPALTGDGGGLDPAPPIYFETLAGEQKGWAPLTGLVDAGHKWIDLPQPELYDLAEDPRERRNLLLAAPAAPDAGGVEGAADEAAAAAAAERDDALRTARRLDRELAELVSTAPGGVREATRELSEEDRRQLAALGYLGGGGGVRGAGGIDPKRAIAIENRVRWIRTVVLQGEAERAAAALAELRAQNADVDLPDFHELEFFIAKQRGQPEAAVAALRRGVAAFPDFASLELRLATYLQEIGRHDEAERHARRLLERDPRNTQATSLLGMAAESRGDAAAARRHFEAALRLEPGSVPLRAKVAEMALRTGDRDRARALYDELLAEGALDDQPHELARSAMLDAALGNLDRAEATMRRVVEMQPAGVHRFSLGMLLLRRGDRAAAAAELRASLAAETLPLDERQRALAQAALQQLGAG
jgi:choline-sulfatase